MIKILILKLLLYYDAVVVCFDMKLNVCFKLQNLLTGRLQWISRLLIEQHSLRKGSSSCGNGIDSAKAGGPAGTCAGAFSGEGGTERAHNRRYSSLTEWIQSLSEPLAVLQRVVLPVVAQHPAVHSLLTHVEQTIEMLSTAV